MKVRPMYRWKTFWFGVFVVLFFRWAWVESQFYRTSFVVDRGGRMTGVLRQEGATYFFSDGPFNEGFWRERLPEPSKRLEENLAALTPVFGGYTKVPDLTVIAPCLLLWCGWLTWRWMREDGREVR